MSDIIRRRELRGLLIDRIAESITSAKGSGRTVADPRQAAEYAVNALTEYLSGRALLAEAADAFRVEDA